MNAAISAHKCIVEVLVADRHFVETSSLTTNQTSTYLLLNHFSGKVDLIESLIRAASPEHFGETGSTGHEKLAAAQSRFLSIASSNGHVRCVSFLLQPAESDAEGKTILAQFTHILSPNHVAHDSKDASGPNETDRIYDRHIDVIDCLSKSATGHDGIMANETGVEALSRAICSASEMNLFDIVQQLCEFTCGELVCSLPPYYFIRAMIVAAEKGFLKIVQLFHDTYHVSLKSKDEHGNCALKAASAQGHRSVVQYILESGSFVDESEKNGELYRLGQPLLLASKNGHRDVVECLLDAGIDLETRDQEGCTPLMLAVRNGHKELVDYLLQRGASLKARSITGWTALMLATFQGVSFDVLQSLIVEQDLETLTDDGSSLFLLACFAGQLQLVEYLLEKNVNCMSTNNNGVTPLMGAAKNGHEDVVKLLMEALRKIDNNKKFIDFLNKTDNEGNSALISAAGKGFEGICKILVDNGATVDGWNSAGYSALSWAIKAKQTATARLLIENGANVNFRTSNTGRTPLMLAAKHDTNAEICRLLIDKGADVNAVDIDDGLTALLIAAYRGNTEVCRVLLDRGANAEFCDQLGCNCLMLAARGGHVALTEHLLSRKNIQQLIDKPDVDGRTALKYAKLRTFNDVVKILRKYGAVDEDS